MNNDDVILEIKGLKKTFSENVEQPVEVLKGINLTVKKGEFISLMGESGSGKSTLLYQIGALDTPTEGEILIDGENIHKANDKQQVTNKSDSKDEDNAVDYNSAWGDNTSSKSDKNTKDSSKSSSDKKSSDKKTSTKKDSSKDKNNSSSIKDEDGDGWTDGWK